MNALSDDILTVLRRIGLGTPIAALRTAAEVSVGPLGRPEAEAVVWCVVTDTHVALVAARGADAWWWADGSATVLGRPADRSARRVRIGNRTVPLPPGSQDGLRRVVDAWAHATQGGPGPMTPSLPLVPTHRANAAPRASLPEGWCHAVPAPANGFWLAATATTSQWHTWPDESGPVSSRLEVGLGGTFAAVVARRNGQVIGWRPLAADDIETLQGRTLRGPELDVTWPRRHDTPMWASLPQDAAARWTAHLAHVAKTHGHDALALALPPSESGADAAIRFGARAAVWQDQAAPNADSHAAADWVRAALADREHAEPRLRAALEAAPLRPQTWASARSAFSADLPSHVRSWWDHLATVVAGGEGSAPPAPHDRVVGQAERNALAPDASWWSEVLGTLRAPVMPHRSTLIAGLEHISAHDREAWREVADLADRLETTQPDTYVFRGSGAYGAIGWPTSPPVLLIGAQHLSEGPRQLSPAARRWLLAVELAHLACEHPPLSSGRGVVGNSQDLVRAFGSYAKTAEQAIDLVLLVPGVDQIARIQRLVLASRRVFATRAVLDKAKDLAAPWLDRITPDAPARSEGLGARHLDGPSLERRLHADRIALALVGDVRAGVEAILKTSPQPRTYELAASRGLGAVLADEDIALDWDDLVRLSSLVAWAVASGPPTPE